MSSKIIVDTIEKKTGDDVTLVGNLDVPTSYKITGTDADSIQAPGLITSAGGGLNTSLNTGLASATLASTTTFPAGHVIGVYTDTFNITSGSVDILSSGTLWTGLDVTVPATSTDNTIIVQVHIAGLSNKAVTGRSALLGLKYSIDNWGNTLTLGPDALIVQPTVYSGGGVIRDSVSFQLPITVPTPLTLAL